MALLDQSSSPPSWIADIMAKRQAGPAPGGQMGGGGAGGLGENRIQGMLGSVLGPLFSKLGMADNPYLTSMFGPMGGGGAAPGGSPMPTRPQPTQFDPMAYLQARLGPGPWAKPPGTPF